MSNTKEIIKILDKIDTMESIGKISIKSDEFVIKVLKNAPDSVAEPQYPTFETAALLTTPTTTTPTTTTNADSGIATAGQIKFARDLIGKVFSNDERAASDFLAYALEIPLADVPDMDSWENTMTKTMVSDILDRLEPMWKSNRRQDGR